jgi:hypothetical protein
MPVETLKCHECGSADVQEVKANTFFCNHCDAVFKYQDPNRATVVQTPTFCSCGNPVEIQCAGCEATICRQCDALGTSEQALVFVEAKACGYLIEWGAGEPALGLDDSLKPVDITRPDAYVMGPVMPARKLIAPRMRTPSRPRYLCWECVVSAESDACALIEAGAICEYIECTGTPSGECPCCKAAFCEMHLNFVQVPLSTKGQVYLPIANTNPVKFSTQLGWIQSLIKPPGVCWSCTAEVPPSQEELKPRMMTALGLWRFMANTKANNEVIAQAKIASAQWAKRQFEGCRRPQASAETLMAASKYPWDAGRRPLSYIFLGSKA